MGKSNIFTYSRVNNARLSVMKIAEEVVGCEDENSFEDQMLCELLETIFAQ